MGGFRHLGVHQLPGGDAWGHLCVCLYREVARLVGEVEDLRQMMESMKRIVTGQGLEKNQGLEWQNWEKRRIGAKK